MFISTYHASINGSHIADIEFLTVTRISEYLRGYNDCLLEEYEITYNEMCVVHSIFSDGGSYISEPKSVNCISL